MHWSQQTPFSNNTRVYTWTSPDGQQRNQIDYILCSQRWRSSKQLAKTRPGADCESDHELIVQEVLTKIIPKKKKYKKVKWLPEEVLQIAEKSRETKGKDKPN